MEKNKYKNSKHFLLIYYPLKKPCLNCKKVCKNTTPTHFVPIQAFDSLIQVKKYITSGIFIKICFDAKIYCLSQLKVLVGIDSKHLKNSVNKYLIKDLGNNLLFTNHGYHFFIEHVLYLEEFIEEDAFKRLDNKIKQYGIKNYWQKVYEDVKYL